MSENPKSGLPTMFTPKGFFYLTVTLAVFALLRPLILTQGRVFGFLVLAALFIFYVWRDSTTGKLSKEEGKVKMGGMAVTGLLIAGMFLLYQQWAVNAGISSRFGDFLLFGMEVVLMVVIRSHKKKA